MKANYSLCFLIGALALMVSGSKIAAYPEVELPVIDIEQILQISSGVSDMGVACQNALQDLRNNYSTKSHIVQIMASGKGINSLGDYSACTNDENSKYFLTYITLTKLSTVLRLGLCLPKECTPVDMQSAVKGLNMTFMEGPVMLRFTDSVKENEDLHEMTTGAVVMIIVLCLLAAFGIIGIIIEYSDIGNKPHRRMSMEPCDSEIQDNKHKWALFFLSFSFTRNLSKLFYSRGEGEKELTVFSGVRVFSMAYVVFGHAYLMFMFLPVSDPIGVQDWLSQFYFTVVSGAFYAVDVFFYMAGFLAAYLLVPRLKKGNFKMIGLAYVRRFYRIFPVLLFTLGVFMYIAPLIGSGPLWGNYKNTVSVCKEYGWANLLFIDNFFDKECMAWAWYLANDMQFFIVTPPIIYIYCRNRKAGYIFAYLMMLTNFGLSCGETALHNHGIFFMTEPTYHTHLYIKPWHRMGVYAIGIIFGYMYYEHKTKQVNTVGFKFFRILANSSLLKYTFYCVGLFLTSFFMFIQHDFFKTNGDWSLLTRSLFNGVSRQFYILGFALIISPCYVLKSPFLHAFLGAKIFGTLTRLSFSVYMIHLPILIITINSLQGSIAPSHIEVMFMAISVLFISIILAVPFTLVCETPFMNIEKFILFPQPKRKQTSKVDPNKTSANLLENIEIISLDKDLIKK